ncbi:MAG: family 43 glycosylhydrolase [Candidatus Cryptobacteroides sp.]
MKTSTSMKALAFVPCALAGIAAGAREKPNIILIMADDMGWSDVGFNGNTEIRTPVMDSLAAQGVVLRNFYSAGPVSSPTRASVMTGRHPYRLGVFDANVGILRPEEISLAELLKEDGYRTGFFGKWHLGTMTHTESDANRGKPGNLREFNPPARHGFDRVFAGESKVPTWDPMKKPEGETSGKTWKYLEPGDPWVPYGTSYFDENGAKISDNLDGDDSRVIMDRALEYMEQSINDGVPFLSVIWIHTPHLPCVAGPEYYDSYEGDLFFRNYAGCITALDDQIGRLSDFINESDQGGNTVMFFCSDNGPEIGTPGTAGEFIGRKRSLNEGGIRVPSFAVWPGRLESGRNVDARCSTEDYLPTIMDIVRGGYDSPYRLDGKSMLPALTGSGRQETKPLCFVYHNQSAIIYGDYKLYRDKGVKALYNLKDDPFERKDIAAGHPGTVAELETMLEEFLVSCKESFIGTEYGTESYDRMGQKWPVRMLAPYDNAEVRIDTLQSLTFRWDAASKNEEKYRFVISKGETLVVDTVTVGNSMTLSRSELDAAAEAAGAAEGETVQLSWGAGVSGATGINAILRNSNKLTVRRLRYYSNPVWGVDMPDPSVICADDGYFYVYATGRNVKRGRSLDLVNWEPLPESFTEDTRPGYVPDASGIWAPDVEKIGGKYLMYYTQTKAMAGGNPNSTIGVGVSDTPDGVFSDKAKLFQARDAELPGGAVDQFYYEENGQKYLFFGSFRGVYGYPLANDGLSLAVKASKKVQVAGDNYEGGMLFKRGDYYFLFASIDKCCSGKSSTYKLVVGRSKNLFGPYLNKEGECMNDNKHLLLLQGDDRFVGPGHCSELLTDDNGDVWILYHSYDMTRANASGNVKGRLLMLDKVVFDEDGWPSINGHAPSSPSRRSEAPVFLPRN